MWNCTEKKICDFTFADLVKDRNQKFPIGHLETICEDLLVKDLNDKAILCFLKDGLRRPLHRANPTQACIDALLKFVGAYPPPKPKTTNVKHQDDVPFGVGVHHLAMWHDIGNPHVPHVLSHNILALVKKYNNIAKFF